MPGMLHGEEMITHDSLLIACVSQSDFITDLNLFIRVINCMDKLDVQSFFII